jgi:hypothetical protein
MLLPMLKAISSMLKDNKDDKVKCAKEVLDELVKHLEGESMPKTTVIENLLDQDGLDKTAKAARQELLSS